MAFTDFRNDDAIRAMGLAIAQNVENLGLTYPAWIRSEQVTTDATFESLNPSSPGDVVARFPVCRDEEWERALDHCESVAAAWIESPLADRAALLRRAAETLRNRRFELAAWLCFDAGATWVQADAEVERAAVAFEQASVEPEPGGAPAHGGRLAFAAPESPLSSAATQIANSLARGRPVVIWTTAACPLSTWKLVELLVDEGLQRGVVQYLPGGEWDRLKALVVDRRIEQWPRALDHVESRVIGPDADPEEAAAAAVEATFVRPAHGRSAELSVEVHASIRERFVECAVEAARALEVGPAIDLLTQVGPLPDLVSWNQARLDVALLAEHASIRTGRVRGEATDGYFIEPIVLECEDDIPSTAVSPLLIVAPLA